MKHTFTGLVVSAWMLLLSGFNVPLPDLGRVGGLKLPNVRFEDDAHRTRELASMAGQPLILVPTYTSCHGTCPRIAAGLKEALLDAELDVREYQVLLFSFDERNTVDDLAAFRRAQKLPASWSVARLDGPAIRALTEALDYRTFWRDGEWEHPNAIAFVSPDQKLTMYLYGTSFSGREVRRALDVARGATNWSTRMAPWWLALGTMGLTLSTVAFMHLLGRRRGRTLVAARGSR